jgi:hypothetical protein
MVDFGQKPPPTGLEPSKTGQNRSKPGLGQVKKVDFGQKPPPTGLEQAIFWSKQAIFGSCGRGGWRSI